MHTQCVHGVWRSPYRHQSLHPPCRFQGLNLDGQTWLQVPLTTSHLTASEHFFVSLFLSYHWEPISFLISRKQVNPWVTTDIPSLELLLLAFNMSPEGFACHSDFFSDTKWWLACSCFQNYPQHKCSLCCVTRFAVCVKEWSSGHLRLKIIGILVVPPLCFRSFSPVHNC